MSYIERIYQIGKENNGYITNKDLLGKDIPTIYLTRLSRNGLISRIDNGIYLMNEYFQDDFYTLSLKYSRMIFCRKSALYLHDLTNTQIEYLQGNFPYGYNITNVQGVKGYVVGKTKYSIGICNIKTPLGNIVKTYDKERCICDLFIYNDFDNEETRYIIRSYKEGGINRDVLYSYAEKLGVLEKIKAIFEVI